VIANRGDLEGEWTLSAFALTVIAVWGCAAGLIALIVAIWWR
jgi:hypothetical protein